MFDKWRFTAQDIVTDGLSAGPYRPPERAYVTHVRTYGGKMEWQCAAGQKDQPVGCERHRDHYWCTTCEGWYGVPHTGMHQGRNAHPNQFAFDRNQCACRPCKIATGRE